MALLIPALTFFTFVTIYDIVNFIITVYSVYMHLKHANLKNRYGKISGTFDFSNSLFFNFFAAVSLACEAHKSDRMYHLQFSRRKLGL